jgi:hypothetical protein
MQRLTRRLVVCGALGLFVACSGDPTDNTGTPTQIVLNPGVLFVPQGDSQPMIVSVVDEDGQALQADFTTSEVGAGIEVVLDPTFLPINSSNPIRRSARFFVKGVDLTATTFKVNALGLSATVQVTSVPSLFTGTFSNTAPALGDTITLTAPTGTSFTDSTVLSFGGQPAFVISQDATTIVFLPPPNVAGLPAGLTNVAVASNPNLVFALVTSEIFTTDSIIDVGTNLTPTAPALGGTVTLVLPPELRAIPESLSALRVAGDTLVPLNLTISPDSGTITFIPPPNNDTTVEVHGVIGRRLPQFPLTVATAARLTTPVVDSIPATVSATTPAANQVVTLTTTNASFTIDPAATVTVGGVPVAVTSTTGNSISFVPAPGDSGNVGVNGVVVAGFPQSLPSQAPDIQVTDVVPSASGTDAPGTAPSLTVPAPGTASQFFDSGTYDYQAPIFGGAFGLFPARLYKLVVPSDRDITVTVNWSSDEDLGAYWFAADGTTEPPELAPADDGLAGGHPESVTNTFAAGTYLLAVVNFSATDPVSISINLTAPAAP